MTFTVDLPAGVEESYLVEAQSRGLGLADVVREVLIAHQPIQPGIHEGLGMFASPEESTLLDEAVALAYEERRRPSARL